MVHPFLNIDSWLDVVRFGIPPFVVKSRTLQLGDIVLAVGDAVPTDTKASMLFSLYAGHRIGLAEKPVVKVKLRKKV